MSSEPFDTLLSELQEAVKNHCRSCSKVANEYNDIFYDATTAAETVEGVQKQMILAKVSALLIAGESVRLVLNYVNRRALALAENGRITTQQSGRLKKTVEDFKNSTQSLGDTARGIRQNAHMAREKQ
ncbi:MAG TPA: hypothetical protein VN081_04805 [Dongiaceae bacterium]|nr:hypothetical protein [Dongiaceae bacterium]